MLRGRRLIERGKYPEAVAELEIATTTLATNAFAWNELGLAYQYGGRAGEAEKAYRRALALNNDLTEAHYNLGCLLLSENNLDGAQTELTAYTLRRENEAEGYLELGTVQLRLAVHDSSGPARLRDLVAAEKNFSEALRLVPQHPEALNGLGLVKLQRGRAGEAVQFFELALKQRSDYGPAMLNLAVVAQQYLRDPQLALKNYRLYLNLYPQAADSRAVAALALQLDRELAPPLPARPTTRSPQTNSAPNPLKSAPQSPARPADSSRPGSALNPPKNLPPSGSAVAATESQLEPTNVAAAQPLAAAGVPAAARYKYRSPAKPKPGNRESAERFFEEGLAAQKAGHPAEAVNAYRKATQEDTSFYMAQYNLGLAASQVDETQTALTAYEYALAVAPDSFEARYNFALLLKQANYPVDAANELERVLAKYPNDTRAHLALGILYAQQLHQNAKARQQYLKVLASEPNNPQAELIRAWLTNNPA